MAVGPSEKGGFLNPSKIIESLGIIGKGMIIADFGCGHGYFTLPIAKKVGEQGKIYAIDVLSETLEEVNSKAKINGITNIETKRGNLEKEGGSALKDKICDIVLISNLLFQTEEDDKVIQEAKRVLKPEGRVIFIDWRKEAPLGPVGKRVSPTEAKELFGQKDFSPEKEFFTDRYHYGIIFRKAPE